MEQAEKTKISSDFIFTKLLFFGIIGILLLLLTDYKRTETNAIIEYVVIISVLSLLLYYIFTRPGIYYDNDNLYITKGAGVNIKIPFENIQSIKFSVISVGQGSYSYRVKYCDTDNKIKSIRIFSSFFSNPISKFISCVKQQNPSVEVSNWSFGINEFFDK